MKYTERLIELIKARETASNDMDGFLLKNHPFSYRDSIEYLRLTKRYLAAVREEMAARTCLAPTVNFLDWHPTHGPHTPGSESPPRAAHH